MATTVTTRMFKADVIVCTWAGLTGSETGDPVQIPDFPEKCVQVIGLITTLDVQGSNDGSTWAVCHKMDGTNLQLAAVGLLKILENPVHLRVVAVGADATTRVIIVGSRLAQ